MISAGGEHAHHVHASNVAVCCCKTLTLHGVACFWYTGGLTYFLKRLEACERRLAFESATQKVQVQCTSDKSGGTQFVLWGRCEHRPTGAYLYYLHFIIALTILGLVFLACADGMSREAGNVHECVNRGSKRTHAARCLCRTLLALPFFHLPSPSFRMHPGFLREVSICGGRDRPSACGFR